MCLACLPPGKDKIRWTIEYYEHQMEELDIDVRLSQEATVEKILGTSPHVLILATGSSPKEPPAGKGRRFISADEALSSPKFQGPGKALVVGGGGIGCETALFLHNRGLQVTIFEQLDALAQDVEEITAWDLKERIKKAKIDVMLNCRFMDLENDKLILEKKEKEFEMPSFDFMVWAAGRIPDRTLIDEMEKSSFQGRFHVIGDAKSAGMIHNAIHDGYEIIQGL
jgi:pyruvate/2-oxoglutarate dehydrogenase complex dihydrolipoamide dehydrogenase (E3) component